MKYRIAKLVLWTFATIGALFAAFGLFIVLFAFVEFKQLNYWYALISVWVIFIVTWSAYTIENGGR